MRLAPLPPSLFMSQLLHSFLNDKTLRRTVEFHLGWQGNSLDSEQAQFVVYQTRCQILTYLEEAAMSPTVHFAVLGVALGPIHRHLQQ
ncbi:hypothetical protein BDN71DRAFT_1508948 [Pleurotus eryngii]|uniref:Uncharacterized protein n=1 Tax=Pleurotus eryngii TaxID=5323 RepID=A0A9P6DEX2_PLEER|nr:hypothetical protein BDN71DRAFT_1508948 [Pleurotus eryngii]